MTASRGSADREVDERFKVLLVAGIALVAAVSGVVAFHNTVSKPSPGPQGFTFFAAQAASNRSIVNASGGPWTLVSALAVVTTQPVWPWAFMGDACEAYPGVSIWNSSGIPIWTGSLSSGISPFWSLWYLNATDYLLAAVALNDTIHLVGPISPTSWCGKALAPTLVNGGSFAVPVDTSVASQLAWNYVGAAFAKSHPELAVYYEIGAQQLAYNGEAPGWAVTYDVCGEPGYAGATLESQHIPVALMTSVTSSSPPTYSVAESFACSNPTYNFTFLSVGAPTPAPNGTLRSVPFTLPFDALVSWMTSANLTENTTDVAEPVASLFCSGGQLNLGACDARGGWYLALANSNGYWLDVYGDWNGVVGWVIPNVPYDSYNSLVVYVPSSLGSTPLTLSLSSVTAAVQVTGAVGV